MMLHHYHLTVADLFTAYYDCRKRKRNTPAALAFEQNLEANLMDLYHELTSGQWQPSPATVFAVTTPKPREVWAADFRDRIVHHLVYRAIGPMFERSFIYDSCACIKGRGTLYAANRLEKHLRSATQSWTKPAYVLKTDVANFFGSIRQAILFKQLEKRVQNEFLLDLLHKLVFQDVKVNAIYNSDDARLNLVPRHKSLLHAQPGIGLPIGNLSSQFFANVYMDDVDQFIKRNLAMKHYVRYVDDMVVIHESPTVLNAVAEGIRLELDKLGMALAEHKTSIEPVSKGVDFVGHIVRPFRRQWRPQTQRSAIRKIAQSTNAKAAQTCTSYLGLARTNGTHSQTLSIARAALKRGLTVNSTFKRSFYAY
ncbi:MAG: RNA-directed DNA polymerase [Methylobacter sp.]|nr:RNA-directed DNA polymerase [Methylobacter sp.]MDP2099844.1 RNA-directed DNA polymerase [Methylobacter sp.]MDP2427964.1 RNA-directed DNA polymerase [Methylobacter sp.]MDP3054224.1 RNA-directed DNA polymerase [Methylobacter sp.]MDP3361139.1 RNA-directed DNA polymerase [Methylobacter sp.]